MEYRWGIGLAELRADGDAERIAGTAAVFYDGTPRTEYVFDERGVERILPGAFNLQDDVAVLFNHKDDLILGRTSAGTAELTQDERGLHYVTTPDESTIYRDVTIKLRRRDVTGSSFGFVVRDDEWRRETRDGKEIMVREIRKVDLYDVGPVTWPAYSATSAALRSHGDASEAKRAMEQWIATRANRTALEAKRRRLVLQNCALEV